MKWSIGLMSGTSLDGIDAALLKTDGTEIFEQGPSHYAAYSSSFRGHLQSVLGKTELDASVQRIARTLTEYHAEAVELLLKKAKLSREDVEIIGFHGQTIWHQSRRVHGTGMLCQIGDGDLLANLTGIDVIYQFRQQDVAQGGEGAPLVPIYHWALAKPFAQPVMMVNIGGIANVTWVGSQDPLKLIAFDAGPGNTLIDQWMAKFTTHTFDPDGQIAEAGRIHERIVDIYMDQFTLQPPPRSFDRLNFDISFAEGLSLEDGAATLTAVTARAIASAAQWVPEIPKIWILMGGGRLNLAIRHQLQATLGKDIQIGVAEEFGWNGDMIEAQAFAFLAQRSLHGLPLSFPNTTGVSQPITGGVMCHAFQAAS